MSDPPADEQASFPLRDTEPPPRSWRYRLGVTGFAFLVVAVVGGGVWAGITALRSGHHSKPPVAAGSADILYYTNQGTFGLAGPTGADATPLPALGTHGADTYASASDDHRFVTVSDGTVIDVHGTSFSVQKQRLHLSQEELAGGTADRDAYLVIINLANNTPGAAVSLLDRQTGQTVSMGDSDNVAGDPQSPGVFETVLGSSVDNSDRGIVLREVGRQPTELVTAARVDQALGQPAGLPLSLSAGPDGTGDEIAVVASTPGANSGPAIGVIVVNRTGQVLATLHGGPEAGEGVAWSPNGTSLLYFSAAGQAGVAVSIWTPASNQPPAARPLPNPFQSAAGCLWSPSGASFVCETTDLTSRSFTWVTGQAAGGALASGPGPGQAVAWLAAG